MLGKERSTETLLETGRSKETLLEERSKEIFV